MQLLFILGLVFVWGFAVYQLALYVRQQVDRLKNWWYTRKTRRSGRVTVRRDGVVIKTRRWRG